MNTYHLATVFGVPIHLHWTVLVPFIFVRLFVDPEHAGLVMGLTFALYLIVTLHEFGHIAAAKCFSMPCHCVLLHGMGGLATFDITHRLTPPKLLAIALAGPAVNLLLVTPLVILAIATGWQWMAAVAVGNVVMMVFNMLPIQPLDGGRCLHAFAWMAYGDKLASLATVVKFSHILSFALGVAALSFGQVWLPCMLLLLAFSSQEELERENAADAKRKSEEAGEELESPAGDEEDRVTRS